MVEVDRRNAATLLPIIQKYILPGTVIVSGFWAAYGGIANLPAGYQHLSVNHSLHCVDPADRRVHAQSVESCWSRFKKVHRTRLVRVGIRNKSLSTQTMYADPVHNIATDAQNTC